MKPKYIFGAVGIVCLLMATILPLLAQNSGASAQPLAAQASIAGSLSSQASAPIVPTIRPTPTEVPPPPAPTQAAAAAGAAVAAGPAEGDIPAQDPAVAAPSNGNIPVSANTPELAAFAASVTNGQAGVVTGVYVSGVFALPVLQQPPGDPNYIVPEDQTTTQYSRPSAYGVIGILAHDTLSGRVFYNLKQNQEVIVIYGDGQQAHFSVSRIENYQALSPNDTHSDFVDLNVSGGNVINYEELFQRVYTESGTLVFQTCIEANGDPSWGRMFIIAKPA